MNTKLKTNKLIMNTNSKFGIKQVWATKKYREMKLVNHIKREKQFFPIPITQPYHGLVMADNGIALHCNNQ